MPSTFASRALDKANPNREKPSDATTADAIAFCKQIAAIAPVKATHATLPSSGRRAEGARQLARKLGWARFPATEKKGLHPDSGARGMGWILTDAGRDAINNPAWNSDMQEPEAS